jgi:hypothetical protein
MTDAAGGRKAVVVLGMHRSGTSLLARLLVALGADFGPRLLLEEMPDNALGYWEQADIVAIQEALMDRLDRTWYGPRGTLPLPEDWRARPGIGGMVRRLADIVGEELAGARRRGAPVWGFKDPRTARFLPLWAEIFAELGVAPVYVMAVRHPAAVCRSLLQRNAVNGMTAARAQLLWAVYNADILAAVGDRLAAVVDYDGWFSDPLATARQLASAAGLPAPVPAALGPFIRPDLRHQDSAGVALLPGLEEMYRAIVSAAPRPPADEIRARACMTLDLARELCADWAQTLADESRLAWQLKGARAAARWLPSR